MAYSVRTTQKRIRIILVLLFFLGSGIFAYEKTRDLISGIRISINSVQDGDIVYDPLIMLEGQARHAVHLTVNDRTISTDTEGYFTEPLLLTEGSSLLTIRAEDTFGKTTEKTLRIAYVRQDSPTPPSLPDETPPEDTEENVEEIDEELEAILPESEETEEEVLE